MEEYETIEVVFEKEQLYQYMLRAHELNITLNAFIEMALVNYMKEHDL